MGKWVISILYIYIWQIQTNCGSNQRPAQLEELLKMDYFVKPVVNVETLKVVFCAICCIGINPFDSLMRYVACPEAPSWGLQASLFGHYLVTNKILHNWAFAELWWEHAFLNSKLFAFFSYSNCDLFAVLAGDGDVIAIVGMETKIVGKKRIYLIEMKKRKMTNHHFVQKKYK